MKLNSFTRFERLYEYRIAEAHKKAATAGTFATEDKEYAGWTFGDTWNGFECPYFEKAEADNIAKDMNGKFLEKENAYVFPDEDPDEKFEMQKIETTDGQKEVWPIGAYFWVWSSAK